MLTEASDLMLQDGMQPASGLRINSGASRRHHQPAIASRRDPGLSLYVERNGAVRPGDWYGHA